MPRGAKSRMRTTETPKPIWIKLCTMVDITYMVTHTNFGDHRLRGFRVAGGQISPFPIDFHRRPYNTLALPCERVINKISSSYLSNQGGSYTRRYTPLVLPICPFMSPANTTISFWGIRNTSFQNLSFSSSGFPE